MGDVWARLDLDFRIQKWFCDRLRGNILQNTFSYHCMLDLIDQPKRINVRLSVEPKGTMNILQSTYQSSKPNSHTISSSFIIAYGIKAKQATLLLNQTSQLHLSPEGNRRTSDPGRHCPVRLSPSSYQDVWGL